MEGTLIGINSTTFGSPKMEELLNKTYIDRYSNYDLKIDRDVSKVIMISMYSIIGTISFVLNSFIFLIVALNKKLWTNSYFLLVSLAFTDWLIIVIGVPAHIANILAGESIMGEELCKVYGYFINVLFQSSVYHLAMIAYHRYLLTVRRKSYKRYFGDSKIRIAVSLAWLIPLVICLMPLFGWGRYYYDASRESCMVDWMYSWSYFVFIEVMVFPSNVSIMAYCYFKIITKSRRRLKATKEDERKAKKRQVELRSTYMLLVVVMTCILCFTPYCILMFYEVISRKRPSQAFGFLSMFFAYSNSMFDFIIYSSMNKRFRRCCRQLFSVCRKNVLLNNSVIPANQPLRNQSSTNKNMRTVNITGTTMTTNNTTGTSSSNQGQNRLFLVSNIESEKQ